jgi:outer membrane lipoprotein-sorting protein
MTNNKLTNILRSTTIVLLSLSFVSWGDSWDQIRNTAKDITSVEAEFIQKKHMAILTKPLVSRGKLWFQIPRSLRWEYSSPVNSILLMHDGTVTRYIKKGDAVTKDSSARLQSMQIVLQEIIMWMKGNFDANPGFKPELKPGRIIVLTPKEKSMAAIIQRIELRLSSTPGVIQSVRIHESEKSFTVIDFVNVKMNLKLPDSLFKSLQ